MDNLVGKKREDAIAKLLDCGFNIMDIAAQTYQSELLIARAESVERGLLNNGITVTDFLDLLNAQTSSKKNVARQFFDLPEEMQTKEALKEALKACIEKNTSKIRTKPDPSIEAQEPQITNYKPS